MKTVHDVQEYIQQLADEQGKKPVFIMEKMNKLKYGKSHITIQFGNYGKRSFSSQIKIINYIKSMMGLTFFSRNSNVYIEGPFSIDDYTTLHENRKNSTTLFPKLNTLIYDRSPPNGSLKYRVKLENRQWTASDMNAVNEATDSLIGCFGVDDTQSIYVKTNDASLLYSNKIVYVNCTSEDDIMLLTPFINNPCWHYKKLEIFEG